jgi:hypothetical protein
VPVAGAVLVLVVVLVETGRLPGVAFFFAAPVVLVGFGAFVRAWIAVPAAYLGFVLVNWIAETAAFLYLGAAEWEARNREHWAGDEPAAEKLLGQLLEYLVFAVFIVPFVALGVAIARGGWRAFREPRQPHSLGT